MRIGVYVFEIGAFWIEIVCSSFLDEFGFKFGLGRVKWFWPCVCVGVFMLNQS